MMKLKAHDELELIALWESLMGASAAVLEAISAHRSAKPDVVIGYLERARSDTAAANVEASRILEGRRNQ